LDAVGEKIGIKDGDLSLWYSIAYADAVKHGFAELLRKYDSLYDLLRNIYPDYDWMPWRFATIPKGASDDPEVMSKALKFVEKELKMTQPEDWYRVSVSQLSQIGVHHLLAKNGSVFRNLKKFRPEYDWQENKFAGYAALAEWKRRLGTDFDPEKFKPIPTEITLTLSNWRRLRKRKPIKDA
jgi:hypothetical protein